MFDDEVDPRGRGATGPVIVVSGPAGVGKSAVSRQIAAVFDRSVHLQTDDFLASIVSVRADPSSPEGHAQNWAVGAALAVSAMTFGELGYVTVVDGTLFPDGVGGLAAACAARRLACHYVVLTADLDTCWVRARTRSASRWPLEREPFEMLHARFGALGLREERLVDASASLDTVCDAVLSAFRAGRLIAEPGPSTPPRTG